MPRLISEPWLAPFYTAVFTNPVVPTAGSPLGSHGEHLFRVYSVVVPLNRRLWEKEPGICIIPQAEPSLGTTALLAGHPLPDINLISGP